MGDPDGGSWPAYPSGKSWDARSGPTGSGKKFYHNVIPGSAVATENFYVAIITPVIHYCMGGLEIDERSRVMDTGGMFTSKKAIPGLYAAGEIAGGVHGNNRLGGNSLLDCVVFGRVAAEDCAKYMLGADVKSVDLKTIHAMAPKKPAEPAPAAPAAAANAPPAGHVAVAVNGPPAVNPEGVIPGTPYVQLDGYRTDMDNSKKERTGEDRLGLGLKVILLGCAVVSWAAIHYATP